MKNLAAATADAAEDAAADAAADINIRCCVILQCVCLGHLSNYLPPPLSRSPGCENLTSGDNRVLGRVRIKAQVCCSQT